MLHLLFHLPTGKLKTFMKFYDSFVLFYLLIYLCLNKQTVKTVMITFIFPIKRINIHLKMQNTTIKYFNNSCLNL